MTIVVKINCESRDSIYDTIVGLDNQLSNEMDPVKLEFENAERNGYVRIEFVPGGADYAVPTVEITSESPAPKRTPFVPPRPDQIHEGD